MATLAQAKDYLRIVGTADDTLLASMLASAEDYVRGFTDLEASDAFPADLDLAQMAYTAYLFDDRLGEGEEPDMPRLMGDRYRWRF